MPSIARLLLLIGLCCGTARSQDRPPTPVIVAEVVQQPLVEDASFIGRVQPRRSSLVAAETEGLVVRRFTDGGKTVTAGELLFQLANDRLKASLQEALADFELRQSNQRRSAELLATDAVSAQDLRDDEYEFSRARAKRDGLEAQVAQLAVRAPFAGHVIQTFTEVGQWVPRGGDIARIISTDTVRVYVNVPEQHVSRLELGATATIDIAALGGKPVDGRIVAVLAEGYAESRTFPVVIETRNPDGRMRSNMSARVHFHIPHNREALLVHKDALVSGPMGPIIYLAVDGKAISRPVQTGLAHQGFVAVDGDIAPGDLAVVRGNERLMDGQAVRIIRKHQ